MQFMIARSICYLLSLIFLFGGFYFLLYSEDLFSNLQKFGIDTKNEIIFWKTLTFAYMITISALSFLVAQNITLYWRAIPVLVIAKLSSSLTGLAFYTTGVALGGVIFVVDFPLAVLFVAIYFWILKVKG
ncbi:MAG: hypothetical protein NZ879_02425 [Archaeoglobaceae archaeon]|nr:hypothetical protein [Archaeoglobaceae archaeon]MDW8117820.1 hypothetical protein [Archaeoglobaceae archaeon]